MFNVQCLDLLNIPMPWHMTEAHPRLWYQPIIIVQTNNTCLFAVEDAILKWYNNCVVSFIGHSHLLNILSNISPVESYPLALPLSLLCNIGENMD